MFLNTVTEMPQNAYWHCSGNQKHTYRTKEKKEIRLYGNRWRWKEASDHIQVLLLFSFYRATAAVISKFGNNIARLKQDFLQMTVMNGLFKILEMCLYLSHIEAFFASISHEFITYNIIRKNSFRKSKNDKDGKNWVKIIMNHFFQIFQRGCLIPEF